MFAFGSDHHCMVSGDSRLRVWSTKGSGAPQQFVEKDHLTSACTSLDAFETKVSGKRKLGVEKAGLVALGLNNGTVSVWDVQRGVVVHKLGKGLSLPPVTDVAFAADGKALYSSSREKEILEWSLETGDITRRLKGDKQGASKLCVSGNGELLAAGSLSIRLVDLATGKRRGKLSGAHTATISQLAFPKASSGYLCSACAGDRSVNVYSCLAGEEALLRSVTLGFSSPSFLALFASPAGPSKAPSLTLVAGSELGSVSFFRFGASSSESDLAATTVELSAGSKDLALGARFHESKPQTHVWLAHGEPSAPVVEVVEYAAPQGDLAQALDIAQELAAGPGAGAPKTKGGEASLGADCGGGDYHVLGAGQMGSKARELDLAAGSGQSKRLKLMTDLDEPTIAERLESLSSALAASEGEKRRPAKAVPTSDSLVTVLSQALQSMDDELLEQCLATTDREVVEATVERLSPARVLPFLLRLADKVERRPNRGLNLCVWLRALLVRHASYLMNVPNLDFKLAGLYQILESRTANFPKLLALNGRLELALEQISSQGPMDEAEQGGHVEYDEEEDEALDDESSGDDDEDDDEEEE